MNWKEVEKKYPKAFGKLNEWYGIGLLEFNKEEPERCGHYFSDGVHAVLMWNDFEIRDLYDFFDEQKILIVVNWYWMDKYFENDSGETVRSESNGRLQWSYRIFNFRHPNFESRTEAENAAFLKAFEILEQKLTKE